MNIIIVKQIFYLFLLFPALLSGLTFPEFPSLRRWIAPAPRVKEYDRFFSPLLFIPYRDQLKVCMSDALKQQPTLLHALETEESSITHIRNFIHLTHESVPAHPKSHRHWHHRWLKQLRHLLTLQDLNHPAVHPLIDRICLWMYSEPDFFDGFAAVLNLDLNLEIPKEAIDPSLLPKILEKSWRKLKSKSSVSGFKKFKSDPNDTHVWDPHLGGMLPTRLFRIGQTQLIYTPRIVQEHDSQVAITPEFLRYLSALESQGKKHLYINLMNRTNDQEMSFSRKIEELERKKKAFHVITLDHNSNFYKQYHLDSSLKDASTFKEAFLRHLFESGSFYWSQALDNPKWRKECQQIIATIHARDFHGKSSLDPSERRVIIDLTYVALIRTLFNQYDFAHANISCKHSMDRAPQLTSLLFADTMMRTGTWSIENVHKFLAIVLSPPLLSHNRPSLERHIERIGRTLPFILNCQGN